MKNQLKAIACIAFLLLISVTTALNAQTTNSTATNVDKQKAVKVINGKIMPADFDLSTIDYKTVLSVNIVEPDSKINADMVAKFGKNVKYGLMIIKTKVLSKEDSIKLASEPEKVYQFIEQIQEFPGGEKKLLAFIKKNVRFPNNVQGRVIVRFVVSSKGKVERAEVFRSLNAECDKEALRVVSLIPDFIPGKQNGINVPVWYTLPITFE